MAQAKKDTVILDESGDAVTAAEKKAGDPSKKRGQKKKRTPGHKTGGRRAPRSHKKAAADVDGNSDQAMPDSLIDSVKKKPASPAFEENPKDHREPGESEPDTESLIAPAAEDEDGKIVQIVGFWLGDEEYGVDIQKVNEINRIVEITRVPRSPDFVEGVINLRGRVVPVIQLRKRFGLEERAFDKDTRIVVMDILGRTIGVIVDSVTEVLRIPSGCIDPPPSMIAGLESEYVKGIGKLEDRLLMLLDFDKVISSEEVQALNDHA